MNERPLPVLPCLCATLRRAARALTQEYEEALRPVGLKATQFTILQTLALAGDVTQGELAAMLAMDSTTLTRTLAIMIRQRWVQKQRGKDRREWRLGLATEGRVQLKRGTACWEKTQSQMLKKLGSEGWKSLFRWSNEVANTVTK